MPIRGTYCLCITISEPRKIQIGRLGKIKFDSGKYIYVGSALNSLVPRLLRHIKTSIGTHRVRHWHIDYFLAESVATINSIYIKESTDHLECAIANIVKNHGSPIPNFGSSDCGCNSHLFKVEGCIFLEKSGLLEFDLGAVNDLLD
jgi:Uri superfamily endonuclease